MLLITSLHFPRSSVLTSHSLCTHALFPSSWSIFLLDNISYAIISIYPTVLCHLVSYWLNLAVDLGFPRGSQVRSRGLGEILNGSEIGLFFSDAYLALISRQLPSCQPFCLLSPSKQRGITVFVPSCLQDF